MIGKTVGRYRIVGPLGAGGMGVVYRADDLTLHRPVALKFLTPELATDEEYRVRFLREARLAARLNHPNTCTVYEVGEIGLENEVVSDVPSSVRPGTPFIAMELVEGETLAARLSRVGSLGVAEALDFSLQVAEGLAAAHRGQIVHRDLKPQNVMIAPDGLVKIVDFGLAKPLQAARPPGVPTSTTEMLSAELGHLVVMGTCAYMSPEQATGSPVDARSDVFGLGVMLYEMLAGRLPFRGDSPTTTIAKILEADPEPLPPGMAPPALTRVIERCLQKRPDDRYRDAQELAGALQDVLSQSEAAATRSSMAGNRLTGRGGAEVLRTRFRTAIAAGLLVVVAAALSYSLVGRLESRSDGANVSKPDAGAEVAAVGAVPDRNVPLDMVDRSPDAASLDAVASVEPPHALDAGPLADDSTSATAKPPSTARPDRLDAPAAALPKAPVEGTLVVTSEPPFSSVTLDGMVVGVTPLTVKASNGRHELTLTSPDRLFWRGRVEVDAGETTTIHRDLSAVGSLTVTSEVWVEVSVDGGPREQTPVHFSRVATGLHQLRVSRQGYVTKVLEVVIEEDKTTTVAVALEKQP